MIETLEFCFEFRFCLYVQNLCSVSKFSDKILKFGLNVRKHRISIDIKGSKDLISPFDFFLQILPKLSQIYFPERNPIKFISRSIKHSQKDQYSIFYLIFHIS